MKFTYSIFVIFALALAAFYNTEMKPDHEPGGTPVTKQQVVYRDGIYTGTSRASYTEEPYWGSVRVRIEKGLIAAIEFSIRDSSLHETFDEKYEKHFEGNQLYVQQCRNDWNGVKSYPKKLAETGSPDKVDVISGATWSYNIFRASLDEALKKAAK